MANLIQIREYLKQRQLQYRLVSLSSNKIVGLGQEAFTVEDVVRAGVDKDDVVKTLVVRAGDGSFVAFALRGKDRIDFKKVRKLFGPKSELAKPEEVLKVVGVPIGAVCPVLVGIQLYFDRKVMDLKNVHMGSGDLMHGLEMKFPDLLIATNGYKIGNLV